MLQKATTFTVYEDEWIHGEENKRSLDSYLKRDDGKSCCMGFYGRTCGLTDKQMLGESTFMGVSLAVGNFMDQFLGQASRLYEINDQAGLTFDARKQSLANLLERHGVTVIFKKSRHE